MESAPRRHRGRTSSSRMSAASTRRRRRKRRVSEGRNCLIRWRERSVSVGLA